MTPEPNAAPPNAPLPTTPALDRLIDRVRARLARLVVLHGVGTVVLVAAAWIAFAFLADWSLHLPAPVRVIHLVVLIVLPTVFAVRTLVRPLRARPNRPDTAVLIERAHPGHSELLVSAVELRTAKDPSGDREHIERVLVDADRAASTIDADPVLDARGPRRRAAAGFAAAAGLGALFFWNAAAAGTFLARIAGGATPWPQRTHLAIEIPMSSANEFAATTPGEAASTNKAVDGEIVVRVARGSDVPVLVHALGEIPEEIVLHFAGGHRSVLGSTGGPIFRTLLRSVQEDMVFHVTGGDDQDESPVARLVVLQPPDVLRVAVSIRPPPYSGLPERVEFDPDVEVLGGSEIVVHVLTTPADVTGQVRLFPEDRVLPFTSAPFPRQADEPATTGFAVSWTPDRSVRYRFELVDAQGLSNPDPGLFGVTVIEDRAPEVEVLSPGRGDFDTVAGGLLPLRVRAQDDFALARLGYEVSPPGVEAGQGMLRDLAWRDLTPEERAALEPERGPTSRASAVARARLAVRDLAALASGAGDAPATASGDAQPNGAQTEDSGLVAAANAGVALEGQQFQLVVRALDAAEPVAHEGRSAAVRVRVVATEEFLRRVQDRLARVQSQTGALLELQREKRRLVLDMLAALSSDAPGTDETQSELAQALTGERRVQGDARALARELSSAAEAVLYARVDERAGAALEILDAALGRSVVRGFDPEPWRELFRATRGGEQAGTGLTAKLIDIAALALEISEDHATAAVNELAQAVDATDLAKVSAHLATAEKSQAIVVERLERLLERLAEWDNFQSVLGLTRDILNGQKSLSERTRSNAKEK